MENVLNDVKKFSVYFGVLFLILGLTSCSNDDDGVIEEERATATGTITASDQTISGNTLIVENVTVGQDSWLVARNAGSENEAAIVSEAIFVEEGTHDNLELPLMNTANLTGNVEGDNFVLMLHEDNPTQGRQGQFDFATLSGDDRPIMDTATGQNIRADVTTTSPTFEVEDQAVENNSVTFNSVTTGPTGGWITLYNQNDDGTRSDEIIGSTFVQAGDTNPQTITFREGFAFTPGQTVFPTLHTDNPADQQFTFEEDPQTDVEEIYGFTDDTPANPRLVDPTRGAGITVN